MSIAALFVLFFVFSSCQKEGPPGPKGDPGNANVKSKEFVVSPSQWQVNTVDNYATATISVSFITEDIVKTGIVEVELKNNNSPTSYTPLPVGVMSYDYSNGLVTLYITPGIVDSTNPVTAYIPTSAETYKITAIAGTAARTTRK